MATRILVVDDSAQWRVLVRSILRSIPSLQIVGEARDGIEAIEKAATLLPDIVLLDIGMPNLNGIEAAPRIRGASPRSEIIFLSQENDSDIRAAALASGAAAYLLKTTPIAALVHTIENSLGDRLQGDNAAPHNSYTAASSAQPR